MARWCWTVKNAVASGVFTPFLYVKGGVVALLIVSSTFGRVNARIFNLCLNNTN